MERLTRDYGEVQKWKGICDRVYGMAKAPMCSWIAASNDLKNAIGIEGDMEYASGIKNIKVAMAELIPDTGIQSFPPKKFVLEFYFQRSFRQSKCGKCFGIALNSVGA